MKIGIDCRLWFETGVGRYIRNLVEELALLDSKNEYILFFRKEEYESVPLPGKNFQKRLADIRWHTVSEQFAFKKILEKEKLNVVHFPYFSYPVGYRGKFIITIHDLILDHFPTGKASTLPSPFYFLKHLGYQFVLKNAISHAQKIITVSGATKQEVIDHYHPAAERVVVTKEGIDKKIQEKNQEKVDTPVSFFLSVGNAYPHKNLERLVDAFDLLVKEIRDVHLIFVGKEDYFSKRLEEYVSRKNLSGKILFYHHITDGQLTYLYKHAEALVIPSLMEGFGLPPLEAMSQKCLVLASEIPAFLEVCGSAALYFDPYDTRDIAKALLTVGTHKTPNITDKKNQGELRAKEFSWKEMAKQTLAVYEACSSRQK